MRRDLEPRIRRLEQQIRLIARNDTNDDRLLRRLAAAEQRMARYRSTEPGENQTGKKAA